MNLLGSTEKKVTNDKNVRHLEINEVALSYFNVANSSYQKDSCFFVYVCPNHLVIWSISFHILRFDLLTKIVILLK